MGGSDPSTGGRGPGMPSMYLAHAFQRPLERSFVMVHCERVWVTPTPLVREYLGRLRAPRKELVVLENAAHFPFLARPERFARVLERWVALEPARW